jgi:centrosomal protein CEP104
MIESPPRVTRSDSVEVDSYSRQAEIKKKKEDSTKKTSSSFKRGKTAAQSSPAEPLEFYQRQYSAYDE